MDTDGIVNCDFGKLGVRHTSNSGNIFRAEMKIVNGCRNVLTPVFCAIIVLFAVTAGASEKTFVYHEEAHEAQSNGPFVAAQDAAEEQPSSPLESDAGHRSLYLPTDIIEEREEAFAEEKNLVQDPGIPLVFNEAVDYYIRYFTTTKRKLFQKWLARKERYAPVIEAILKERGVPEDLIYLAMIESGFNLRAYSPQRAAGPWQFIPETGRRYGLVVNHWIDERRDIEKSTVAAARYLQELFNQFNCWYLAAAGYNAGENRIDRLIKRHNTNDFWQLRTYNTLPRETREYVPQLIAAAVIAKNPERYGMTVTGNTTALTFEKETVPGGIPLQAIARAASSSVSSIRALNPEIRRGILPPGNSYEIRLPAETDIVTFKSSLPTILNGEKRVVNVIRHVTKKRDNLHKIARRYGVTKNDLILVNHPFRLRKGTAIYVPRFAAVLKKAAFTRKVASSKGSKSTKYRHADFHVIKRGETLASISAMYKVDVKTLKRINHLKNDRIIQGTRLSLVSHVKGTGKGTYRKHHRVKGGETLSTIARKYGKSVRTLMRMNGLKNSRIRRGTLLRVSSFSGVHSASFLAG